ncbi:hypothetical protein IKQ21_08135, partial [bacterium]|nr:hypothetical protein [bacterium]
MTKSVDEIKIGGKVINFSELRQALKSKKVENSSVFDALDKADGKADHQVSDEAINAFIANIKFFGQKHNKKNLGKREYKNANSLLTAFGINLSGISKKQLGIELDNIIKSARDNGELTGDKTTNKGKTTTEETENSKRTDGITGGNAVVGDKVVKGIGDQGDEGKVGDGTKGQGDEGKVGDGTGDQGDEGKVGDGTKGQGDEGKVGDGTG